MADFEVCLAGTKVCDNVCIKLEQICCPRDSPELNNAGGCDSDEYCIPNGCCKKGRICGTGPGVNVETTGTLIDAVQSIIDSIDDPSTSTLTETVVEAEATEIAPGEADGDVDDEEETETETVVGPAVTEPTVAPVGGGSSSSDDVDDGEVSGAGENGDSSTSNDVDDNEGEVGGTEGNGDSSTSNDVDDDEGEAGGTGANGGSNANRPNTASPPPNPLSTAGAVSVHQSSGVAKKALLGLGLLALLAL